MGTLKRIGLSARIVEATAMSDKSTPEREAATRWECRRCGHVYAEFPSTSMCDDPDAAGAGSIGVCGGSLAAAPSEPPKVERCKFLNGRCTACGDPESGMCNLPPDDEDETLSATASSPAPKCTCWLGDPGAQFGSSDERQRCAVHGRRAAKSVAPKADVIQLAREVVQRVFAVYREDYIQKCVDHEPSSLLALVKRLENALAANSETPSPPREQSASSFKPDTYTAVLWASLSDDERYAEYLRARNGAGRLPETPSPPRDVIAKLKLYRPFPDSEYFVKLADLEATLQGATEATKHTKTI